MFNHRHIFNVVWQNQSYIFNNMEEANNFINTLPKHL